MIRALSPGSCGDDGEDHQDDAPEDRQARGQHHRDQENCYCDIHAMRVFRQAGTGSSPAGRLKGRDMPANERLRVVMLERGETEDSLAEVGGVDPKTVERWIRGRAPYTRKRHILAWHLRVNESYRWPGSKTAQQIANLSESEILTVYPKQPSEHCGDFRPFGSSPP